MTRHLEITLIAAVAVLGAASASFAGPTDGSRQGVSPPTSAAPTPEPRTKPYALTGSETPESGTPTRRTSTGWRRSVERLGNKVEIDRFER
jgi:hypothetical protein